MLVVIVSTTSPSVAPIAIPPALNIFDYMIHRVVYLIFHISYTSIARLLQAYCWTIAGVLLAIALYCWTIAGVLLAIALYCWTIALYCFVLLDHYFVLFNHWFVLLAIAGVLLAIAGPLLCIAVVSARYCFVLLE